MGKRINESFLNAFNLLDKRCCERFGLMSGGVTEYINRLNNARFAPRRDAILPVLVRYRNLRNRLAHEAGAMKRVNEITKADVQWVKRFDRDVLRQRDPIAQYLKRARAFARRKRVQRYFVIGAVVVLVAAVTVLIVANCIK